MISALVVLALGLLPAAAARAQTAAPAPAATMSCHDMGAMGDQPPAPPEAPSHDMQACAKHCLSQVNAPAIARPPVSPPLRNAIAAPLADTQLASKPRLKEAPDPPPPRS